VFKYVPLFCSCNICSVVGGSEGVCVFCEVFGEVRILVSCSECVLLFLEPCGKVRPVCPTYAFPQSGHVNLYTSDRECMSEVCCICINDFCIVLLVRNAICMLVFLNRLLMNVVSLPT